MKNKVKLAIAATVGIGVLAAGAAVALPTKPLNASIGAVTAVSASIDYGQQYLDIVCPSILQRESYDNTDWADADFITYGETVPQNVRDFYAERVKLERREAKRLAAATWPTEVQDQVNIVAAEVYESVLVSKERANTETFGSDWPQYPKSGKAASRVRLMLDLPPRGKGC